MTYEKDGDGNETRRTYDHAGRLTSTTDAVGRIEERSYFLDGQPKVIEKKSKSGVSLFKSEITAYDALHRPAAVMESGHKLVLPTRPFTYDDKANSFVTTDRNGVQTKHELDDLGRPIRRTLDESGLNFKKQFEYDKDGNLSAVVDELGRRTESDYDFLHRVTRRRLPMGVTEEIYYDGAGRTTATVDGRGVRGGTTYDEHGRPRVTTLVRRDKSTLVLSTLDYVDGEEPKITLTDARGFVTTVTLDSLDREWKSKDPLGFESETTYYARNKHTFKDKNGNLTEWTYDGVDRVKTQTDTGSDASYTISFDYSDGDASATDPLTTAVLDRRGILTATEVDGLGRTKKITRSVRGTEMEYDGNGNLTKLTDPNKNVTVAEFDKAGLQQNLWASDLLI